MIPLADQTAGPNGLIFLWTLMGSLGVEKCKTKIGPFFLNFIFFKIFVFYNVFFFPRATPGLSASIE